MARWAFLYEHPGREDRHQIDGGGQTTLLVGVPDAEAAVRVADELAADGVGLIELCGGFTAAEAARVAAVVGDRAGVGHVTYAADALAATLRYAEQAAADSAG